MKSEEIQVAADVLGWMAEHFARLPEEEKGAVTNALACQLAQMLCLDLVLTLVEGADPYDAFVSVARGGRTI